MPVAFDTNVPRLVLVVALDTDVALHIEVIARPVRVTKSHIDICHARNITIFCFDSLTSIILDKGLDLSFIASADCVGEIIQFTNRRSVNGQIG